MKNIILFGYGKMGSSIAKGWLLKKLKFNFIVVENLYSLRKIAKDEGFEVYKDVEKLSQSFKIKKGDVIFLAVKPQQMKNTIQSFLKFNFKDILFISIAAGLSLSWFQKHLDCTVKVVRTMPNLPASVGFGITGYFNTSNLTQDDKDTTKTLLTSFGKVIHLASESLIDVITAISGSGPAYIFYFVEVLSEIGIKNGLSKKDAKKLALSTLIGSSRLLEKTKIDPQILKKNVTSPGGTTEAGLQILESKEIGLFSLLDLTIEKAKKRALDLNTIGE